MLYRGEGCNFCYQTGYKGRHGIYELMLVTSFIKKQVMRSVEAESIRKVAKSQEMNDLLQNGAIFALNGVTTASEVFRVAKATEMAQEA